MNTEIYANLKCCMQTLTDGTLNILQILKDKPQILCNAQTEEFQEIQSKLAFNLESIADLKSKFLEIRNALEMEHMVRKKAARDQYLKRPHNFVSKTFITACTCVQCQKK